MRKRLHVALFTLAAALLQPVVASPIECTTKNPPTNNVTTKPLRGISENNISSSGKSIESKSTDPGLLSLAHIKRNQDRIDTELSKWFRNIKYDCREGENEYCKIAKRNFLDAFAWAYNSQASIDCKYTKFVSKEIQYQIVANPLKFLKKSRFTCSPSRDQLCCASCIVEGTVGDSSGW